MKPRYITEENFLDIIAVNKETNCWDLDLPTRYGRTHTYRFEGRKVRPVHIYWKLTKGAFPKNRVSRKCNSPSCVNPEHYSNFSSSKERFLAKIKMNAVSGCWEWVASTDTSGYGHMNIDGKITRSHRFSYEYYVGTIPFGYDVLHDCDNRICCNPAHLFLGKDIDNVLDREAKGRNPHKLSPITVKEIRAKRTLGYSTKQLCIEYGVKKATIYRIDSGKAWRWVND